MGYNNYEGVLIQTYVINSRNRNETLRYIEKEFADFNEFEVSIVEAGTDRIYNVAIWESLVGAVNIANNNSDDVIIICDEKHEFAAHYTKEFLIKNIIEANEQGANILLGDVDRFGHVVPISMNRFWVDAFSSSRFIVLYNRMFSKIIDYKFKKTDLVGKVLSEMTSHKMILHPFMSKKFTSDSKHLVIVQGIADDHVPGVLRRTGRRLDKIRAAYIKYIGLAAYKSI